MSQGLRKHLKFTNFTARSQPDEALPRTNFVSEFWMPVPMWCREKRSPFTLAQGCELAAAPSETDLEFARPPPRIVSSNPLLMDS